MGYVALKNLRFGDQWLAPGERVPVEPGRNYVGMVRAGLIEERLDRANAKPSARTDETDVTVGRTRTRKSEA